MRSIGLKIFSVGFTFLLLIIVGCGSSGNKKSGDVKNVIGGFEEGTYGYDVAFLKENNIETIELKDENSGARVVLAPGYQGRVMTSSANYNEGNSFGWMNYDLIASGEIKGQFNPVGGEDRFWLGPEGGPYSIYFEEGKEQIYENWKVPAVLDTESFGIKEQNSRSVTFKKNTELTNASGTKFNIAIKRTVSLLSVDELKRLFNVDIPTGIFDIVTYESENTITNTGSNPWTEDKGLLSIWILSMFNPSPATTVFIPYEMDAEGPVVKDDYFGKIPSERLIIEAGTIYFKIDGKYRSKIGVPPGRATELSGSYDSEKNILTLVSGTLPPNAGEYVNSQWGEQDNPYNGDAINAYNDGPVEDGSIMGPFYEIETSSPGAKLKPGESLTHFHLVAHIQGDPIEMAKLVNELFDLNLYSIADKFK